MGSVFITIGDNCSVTAAVEAVGARQASGPFEHCIAPCVAVIAAVQDNFKSYVDPDFFVPYLDQQSPVNKYGICLAHNFPIVTSPEGIKTMDPDWRRVLPAVQEKFERRIQRFKEACQSTTQKVIFVRYLGMSEAQATILSKHFQTHFPCLDFTIAFIGHQQMLWNIPHVRCFAVNGTLPKGDPEGWHKIFAILLAL